MVPYNAVEILFLFLYAASGMRAPQSELNRSSVVISQTPAIPLTKCELFSTYIYIYVFKMCRPIGVVVRETPAMPKVPISNRFNPGSSHVCQTVSPFIGGNSDLLIRHPHNKMVITSGLSNG